MKYIKLLLIGLLAVIGLGYRTFSVNARNDLYKGVYYDNINYTDNVTFKSVDGVNIDYSAELNVPGDYYELTFDVINGTRYDIMITDCVYNENDDYIDYELTYEDGRKIKNGDIIKKGQSKRIKYKVLYKNLIQEEYSFDTGFSIMYEQAFKI